MHYRHQRRKIRNHSSPGSEKLAAAQQLWFGGRRRVVGLYISGAAVPNNIARLPNTLLPPIHYHLEPYRRLDRAVLLQWPPTEIPGRQWGLWTRSKESGQCVDAHQDQLRA